MSTPSGSQSKSRSKLTGPIVVGKDILELLSSAMYVDPLSVYREYLQNAVDALDAASNLGLPQNVDASVEITVNTAERRVLIRDFGTGVSKSSFAKTLTAIGGSKKRGTSARGFRGVGRLAGLGYCHSLTMRSKTAGDDQVTALHWDCRRLKELLRDPAEMTLEQILAETVELSSCPATNYPNHFFEIEMQNVGRFKNDILLNEKKIEHYLSQVAPVPFHPDFPFGKEIEVFLVKHNAGKAYSVKLNGRPIYRPFKGHYEAKPNVNIAFSKVEFYEIPGLSNGIDAVGWILHSDYLGAIPERHGIQSLRVRVGNIQIGDARLLDQLFAQQRFNAWAVGECHIVSSKIVPNARRDDFEQNPYYTNVLTHLSGHAKSVLKACRDCSAERTRKRKQSADVNAIKVDWGQTRSFFQKHGETKLHKNHKNLLLKKLQNGGITYLELISMFTEAPSRTSAEN